MDLSPPLPIIHFPVPNRIGWPGGTLLLRCDIRTLALRCLFTLGARSDEIVTLIPVRGPFHLEVGEVIKNLFVPEDL
jgi:hypothetical protein